MNANETTEICTASTKLQTLNLTVEMNLEDNVVEHLFGGAEKIFSSLSLQAKDTGADVVSLDKNMMTIMYNASASEIEGIIEYHQGVHQNLQDALDAMPQKIVLDKAAGVVFDPKKARMKMEVYIQPEKNTTNMVFQFGQP